MLDPWRSVSVVECGCGELEIPAGDADSCTVRNIIRGRYRIVWRSFRRSGTKRRNEDGEPSVEALVSGILRLSVSL
jgi:hypothetical protein